MNYLEIAKSCGAHSQNLYGTCDRYIFNEDQLHAYTEQICKQMVEALKVKAARWEKCKTMSKQWWLNAMEEAGLKGGRSLDEQIDATINRSRY